MSRLRKIYKGEETWDCIENHKQEVLNGSLYYTEDHAGRKQFLEDINNNKLNVEIGREHNEIERDSIGEKDIEMDFPNKRASCDIESLSCDNGFEAKKQKIN